MAVFFGDPRGTMCDGIHSFIGFGVASSSLLLLLLLQMMLVILLLLLSSSSHYNRSDLTWVTSVITSHHRMCVNVKKKRSTPQGVFLFYDRPSIVEIFFRKRYFRLAGHSQMDLRFTVVVAVTPPPPFPSLWVVLGDP